MKKVAMHPLRPRAPGRSYDGSAETVRIRAGRKPARIRTAPPNTGPYRLAAAFFCALAILGAQTSSGLALEVSRNIDIGAPPAAVWAIMGDFCAIARWHPQVERCILSNESEDEGETVAVRGLVAAGGLGTIVEVETRRDETAMTYSYAFVQGPLPVKAYNATIVVHPNGPGSTVVWTATFDASGMSDAEAKADIEGVYEAGLAGIAKESSR